MRGCVFITKPDANYGFAITGFQQLISDKETILADIKNIVQAGSSGLIFIDERLLNEKVNAKIEIIEKRWDGTIVILPEPGPETAMPRKKDFGMQLITKVLGYQMKLN